MKQRSVPRRLVVAIAVAVLAVVGLTFVAGSPAVAIGPGSSDPSNPPPQPPPTVVTAPGPPPTVDPYDPV